MKNYLTDATDASEYILSYDIIKSDIKGSVIVINLANKKSFSVPYTEENEYHVQEIMNNQLENSKRKKLVIDRNMFGAVAIVSGAVTALFGLGIDQVPNMPEIVTYAFPIAQGLVTVIAGTFTVLSNNTIKDYDKNSFILNNECELNKVDLMTNESIKENFNKRVKNILDSESTYYSRENPINLNTSKSLRMKDLEELKEQLTFADKFYNGESDCKKKIKKM